jgi:uncharacterized RDD family membrane protein YckC
MTATQQPDPFGAQPATGGPSGPRAGFWLRFGAVVIDGLIIVAAYVPLAIAVGSSTASNLCLIASIAYYTLLEGGARGQTVGKMAVGIRVIDLARGGPIGPGRAFIRWLGRIVSTIPVYLGYFWMLWDKEKQTWHDKMAGSVVVPTSAYPVG